ncbi:MAG TPA: hypothetical protein VGD43_02100 [Micromonospora sp.]
MPVFDDSVRGTHPEDYQLLQHGPLHFYRHRWARERLLVDLEALGYEPIEVDLGSCRDPGAVRRAVIQAVPGWPTGYGEGTWAGFADGLTDHLLHADRQQVVLVLTGWGTAYRADSTEALVLLDLLAGVARWHLLFGRRLICLVETDDPHLELPGLGGEQVGWNRHEWLYPHRMGSRIPPWIEPDSRHQPPRDDRRGTGRAEERQSL